MKIELTEFKSGHLALLRGWLIQPHVERWYPDPESNLAWASDPPEGGAHAAIEVDGEPVGYIRWQLVSREILDSVGLNWIPSNSADVDILIGVKNRTSMGIGSKVLSVLLSRLLEQGDVPLVGLTTSIENTNAQKAFTKAGFKKVAEYTPEGFGKCFLFAQTLDH